ncbi:DUF2507 domain-containing protein [Lacticaseibacillus casei]|uniref:DUF2507 domain-containing protein n=1 Tax=Lacticaseibacillus casei TaxID=1582 RepID=UPI001107FE18|nr:DUF2507 domain-containing protein [Lacticaseibacillus casei]TLQ51673.1 DUF2507 domain-containing protein [Lacticaseibacillus casei]
MAKSDYTTLLNLPGSVSFFAVTAMRDLMLPNMLGEEQHHILYWSGRDLATKLPVDETALPQLFTQVGFGTLTPLKQMRQERQYLLAGDVVATRIRTYDDPDFQLEAGFLAQSLQQVLGFAVEGGSATQRRDQNVVLTVVMDNQDSQPTADHLIDLAPDDQ